MTLEDERPNWMKFFRASIALSAIDRISMIFGRIERAKLIRDSLHGHGSVDENEDWA